MATLKLAGTHTTVVTRKATSEWDRDDTNTTWTFTALHDNSREPFIHSVEVGYVPVRNATYYALIATYNTSDSFGHDRNARVELIDVYESYDAADIERERIEKDQFGDGMMEYYNSVGDLVRMDRPWSITFDTLSEIAVYPLLYR